MRASIALFTFALLIADRGGAQSVRGVVITPDSALVPGAIVTLLDSTGTAVARALGDDGGQFSLRAPAPGTYRLEAKRLAFRPTLDVPIVLTQGRVLLHNIVLTGTPVQLPGVRVTAEAQCYSHADSSSAAFAVWEEARKALRASQLTRLTRDYTVDVTTFVRRRSPGLERWRTTDTVARPGMSLKPFVSRPADQLEKRGYMTREHGAEVFHAPDEDVLLSESFAATHCLRMLPDSGGQDVVRLGFAPTPGRRQPEIAGVLTIDRATSELRRLDFSFVNLPVFDVRGSPGGEIIFLRLPEGSWIIEQWAIWLPVAEARTDVPPAPQPPTRGAAPPRIVIPATTRFGMRTTGGRVTRVAFRDETLWLRPVPEPAP